MDFGDAGGHGALQACCSRRAMIKHGERLEEGMCLEINTSCVRGLLAFTLDKVIKAGIGL